MLKKESLRKIYKREYILLLITIILGIFGAKVFISHYIKNQTNHADDWPAITPNKTHLTN
jgi:hypothetical protein